MALVQEGNADNRSGKINRTKVRFVRLDCGLARSLPF